MEKIMFQKYLPLLRHAQISIPNNVQLHSITWSRNEGFIAAGGEDGLLKVLKLESTNGKDGVKGLAAPTGLQVNQNLEGHSGTIQVVAWNESYQKLTSSDSNGLIIVWMIYKGSWYEEMINNRNKSVVTDMAWSADGSKICIVYEDGVVIVGSVDGNRLWSKEVTGNLVAVEWSPDNRWLLFGLNTNEVHLYDIDGNFSSKLQIHCLNEYSMSSETRLKGIKWFSTTPPRIHAEAKESEAGADASRANGSESPQITGPIDGDQPSLCVYFDRGCLQLMRHENDPDAISIQFDRFECVSVAWSNDGRMLAIAGTQTDWTEGEQNAVHFVTAEGQKVRTMKVPGKCIAGCSWESSGLRVCLAVDSHIFFANIRPDYMWGYCGETAVYSYPRYDANESCVVFWDVKLEEVYVKHLRHLIAIASHGEYCVIVNRADDPGGQYLLQLCNGIGTPVDFKYTDLQPKFVAMNDTHVVACSKEAYYIWQYSVPKQSAATLSMLVPKAKQAAAKELMFHVDEIVSENSISQTDIKRHTNDPICAVYVGEKCFILARESGIIQRHSLPSGSLANKYTIAERADHVALNCTSSRLSVINTVGALHMYDLQSSHASLVPGFERKDVWNMQWDSENDTLLAIMEKTRMFVIRGVEAEEPIVNSGYICRFKDLCVRTVLLDELVRMKDTPDRKLVVDIEIKSLRDAKQMLEKMNIQEATAFIEQNSHPKLWSLLAEVSLNNMDTSTAEHAFVKLKDYAGIQFVKKVNGIQLETLKRAEIAGYFGRFDEAEKIYLENDRRDLAIALRRRMHDWFRILQILQTNTAPGDDELLLEAWNHVGDYFADRQKWSQAERHYEPGRNNEKLFKCYQMTEDFEKLEQLCRSLPENHQLLPEIGEVFATAGLCDQAVEAYNKCGQVKSALDCCIQLNHWEMAVQLAKTHDVKDIDTLLEKYAARLQGDPEKSMAAVQLYRKAGRYLDAAKLIYQLADEEKDKQSAPAKLKKLYVAAALLVEQHHEQSRSNAKSTDKTGGKQEAKAALRGLLEEDNASGVDTKVIDNAWRGAEAFHFYMLAQRQLHEGTVEAAMKTALHLTEYDDILDPLEIFSLLALASCAARQFAVCSRAFIKLESLDSITPDERIAFQKLALNIFTKNNPKDSRTTKAECTGCETLIPDYCQICPSCETKFPTCIVTGRALMDYQFWLCPVCKHRAYEQQIQTHKYCPLCHTSIY